MQTSDDLVSTVVNAGTHPHVLVVVLTHSIALPVVFLQQDACEPEDLVAARRILLLLFDWVLPSIVIFQLKSLSLLLPFSLTDPSARTAYQTRPCEGS